MEIPTSIEMAKVLDSCRDVAEIHNIVRRMCFHIDKLVDSIDTPETVIESIRSGQYDKALVELSSTVSQRLKDTAWQRTQSFRPGDRVKFIAGRPHYLIGSAGTVERVMSTYISVRLDRPIGKFDTRPIRCPINCMEKIV